MTTTAAAAAMPVELTRRRPIPLHRLLDVELRKLVDTRASRWLLALIPVLTIVVVTAVTVAGRDDEVTFSGHTTTNLMPLELLLPLVAILSVTSEWSQRAALSTFALVPRRGRVIAAKAIGVLIVSLAATAVVVVLSVLGTVVAAQIRGTDAVWDLPVDTMLRLTLGYLIAVAFGFLVAVLIRSTAPAMVAYLAFMFVVPMVSLVVASWWTWWAENGAWLDLSWSLQLISGTEVSGQQWAQFATSSLIWIALPLTVGLRRLLRVEIR